MAAMKNAVQALDQNDLLIQSPEGRELFRFPPEVVTSLRRMLTELMYQATLPRSIACLAALRGEGVTYNTLALGATLASDVDAKVCVVELNWWAPGLQAMLAGEAPQGRGRGRKQPAVVQPAQPPLPASPGVAGVVRGQASLDEALIKTDRPNLDLLPAGELPPQERAAMARGEQIRSLLEDLYERYDYVLIDTPALAITSDALAFASQSEGTCLVVLQGVTQANTVKSALDSIKHLTILGVILNQVKLHTPRWMLNLLPQE